jgi:hypothetical protein
MTDAISKMSPYKYAQRQIKIKQKEKERKRGARGSAVKHGKCGAKRKQGGTCRMAAGFGTDHLGIGRCKWHGGNLPAHRMNSAKQEAVLMGAPKDINPIDALMWCIRLTAGEVEFCTEQMELLEKDEWLEHTILGKQLHIWAKERQNAVDRLAKFSSQAISLGIAERAVRVAEMYGQSIAKLVRGILDDLELSKEQAERAPHIVRKHLILLEGTRPLTEEERARQPRIPRRLEQHQMAITE